MGWFPPVHNLLNIKSNSSRAYKSKELTLSHNVLNVDELFSFLAQLISLLPHC